MSEYIIALLKCKKIGNNKLYRYIRENNFELDKIKKNIKLLLCDEDYENFDIILEEAKKEIKLNESYGINLITILDKKFPSKLYLIDDPVLYLYYKGDINLINKNSLLIIGSRKASDVSLQLAHKAGYIFGKNNIPVVSGLAIGVDAASHLGVLGAGGKAIAILPSNLNNILPKSNVTLANKILENGGCLVSEYSVGFQIEKYCYAKRDRIQSAIANTVLVIEANQNSGTMIAVNNALKQNKKVFQLDTNKNTIIKYNINLNNETDIASILLEINKNKDTKTNIQISLF